MTATTTAPAHEVLWEFTNAVVPARCLQLVAELGVADHIADAPITADRLGSRLGVDAAALDRVLRLLVAHGIFVRSGAGYAHTETSALLRTDHPRSMRAFARMMGLPVFWTSFAALDSSVRTGGPSIELVEPRGLFAYLADHPREGGIFNDAMAARSRAAVADVVDAYDFGPFPTIADVAGGQGELLEAVLAATPAARGTLFDLPGVIGTLDPASSRMTAVAGDFFVDPLPPSDLYLLMEIMHDWPDPDATAILRSIRRACAPGTTVLIIEGLVQDDHIDPRVHTLDVLMLAVTGGRERTVRDMERLLNGAGFCLTSVIPTSGPMAIVEAAAR